MIRAFHTAATGMIAQQFVVDNTANNLANVNTTGFKKSQVDFQDLIYLNLRQPGIEQLQGQSVPTGLQIGNGVRVSGNTKLFTQGTETPTGDPLNLAIDGEGFFQITAPDGTLRYTRDGTFLKNANGDIVTADGFFLSPRITIPQDAASVSIGSDGTVSVTTSGAPTTASTIGQIQLARFPNPAGLSSEGRNLYRDTPASGAATTGLPSQNNLGLLRQGFLEGSNVEVVSELVNLLLAQRAYEFNTKAIRVSDDMLSATNDLVR
ncbi:MAG TPA: flagellar basal-body rod protein FlgG [Gemmataceae bacterium]|nr:flagellar basal-body rod protein FlgG [Gemmataceae bacterium]